jgi:hypothetical protein
MFRVNRLLIQFAIGGLLDAPDTNGAGGDAPSPPAADNQPEQKQPEQPEQGTAPTKAQRATADEMQRQKIAEATKNVNVDREQPRRPTRGRIVEFTANEQDAETYPAIVTKVDGDNLHLCVFDAVFGPRNYLVHADNPEGGAGGWNWPARV